MRSDGLEMVGDINSSDGITSLEFESITGKVSTDKNIEIDGDTQIDGTLKVTGGSPTSGKILYTTNAQGTLSYVYASVPSLETIIFDEDTAVAGYVLHTGFNDGIVYITKGSAAGGETGGAYKTGGTWTQPGHDHGGYTGYHTLTLSEIPSHRHGPTSGQFHTTAGSYSGLIQGGGRRGAFSYTGYTGGGTGHRHDLGSLTLDNTPNTWRPYGRNFTRQTKL